MVVYDLVWAGPDPKPVALDDDVMTVLADQMPAGLKLSGSSIRVAERTAESRTRRPGRWCIPPDTPTSGEVEAPVDRACEMRDKELADLESSDS